MFRSIKRYLLEHTRYGKSRYLNFLYKYDMQKYLQHSCMNENSIETIATEMRIIIHTIEKAMSLPDCKDDFGKEKVDRLIQLYYEYENTEDRKDFQVLDMTKSIVEQYVSFRKKRGIDISFIPEFFLDSCEDQEAKTGIITFLGKKTTEFEKIAKGRHSLRYYDEKDIDINDIKNAVAIAQTAPSACNRQAIHVFACIDKHKISQIISMHGGVRGFGKPTVIFVITGDLRLYQSEYERNTVFVDGGIFLMNLLYSLEVSGMASCPIIWGSEPDNDKRLVDILSIPASHKIISLVTAGYFPKGELKAACSSKRDLNSILHIV